MKRPLAASPRYDDTPDFTNSSRAFLTSSQKEEKRAADKEKVKEDAEQAHVELQELVDGYFNENQSQA
jgi:hypothetical protein